MWHGGWGYAPVSLRARALEDSWEGSSKFPEEC